MTNESSAVATVLLDRCLNDINQVDWERSRLATKYEQIMAKANCVLEQLGYSCAFTRTAADSVTVEKIYKKFATDPNAESFQYTYQIEFICGLVANQSVIGIPPVSSMEDIKRLEMHLHTVEKDVEEYKKLMGFDKEGDE